MCERKVIDGYGLYGAEDVDLVYEPKVEVDHYDALGNPVMENDTDPSFVGIPTGPEELPEVFKSKYPVVKGNDMHSDTNYPLLI